MKMNRAIIIVFIIIIIMWLYFYFLIGSWKMDDKECNHEYDDLKGGVL